MSTPRNDVDEWVLASAAEVARNVARHGVPITWSEAAERLRRTVELLSGPVFVIDDGGTFTPLPQQEIPLWQETGFAESVACAAVHYAGQPYYPENPKSSRVELAVPWDTATALVHLLSALLVARLTGPTPSCNQEQVEAAQLLNRLSDDVAFEFSRDRRGTPGRRGEGGGARLPPDAILRCLAGSGPPGQREGSSPARRRNGHGDLGPHPLGGPLLAVRTLRAGVMSTPHADVDDATGWPASS